MTITAQTAIKGFSATKFKEEDLQIDVTVKLKQDESDNYERIGRILVRSPLEFDVELAQLVEFIEEESSSEIARNIGTSLSRVLADVEKEAEILQKEYPDYVVMLGGEREKMAESFGSLIFVMILALVFVYMIMAAQFESLWQPFIIMFTIPLTVIGVVAALFISGTSLNVVVLLGLTMLGGIVVNNGIVLIDHYNSLQKEKGEDLSREIIIEGSTTRLRPVLMTALTTTLGLIPMAIAGGQK